MKRILLVLGALALIVPAPSRAAISPDAKEIMTKVGDAYAKLKSLELSGKLSGEFDVDGQQDHQEAAFNSSFAAPNKFRSEVTDDATIGSTGEKLYLFAKQRRLYKMTDAPKEKVAANDLPDPFGEMFTLAKSKNPSLALAMSKDPVAELGSSFDTIAKGDDVKLDGKSYTALKMSGETQPVVMTLLIDPATNLLRRVLVDVTGDVKKQGASDVKKALITIDYTTVTPDAPAKADAFAWAPPLGSRDADEIASGDEEESEASKALLGKPAPTFTLKGLDGKEVALSDLKGSVVVLDFWATWCGPCVMSLPKIDQLYKDKNGDGLKVFAVNQQEETELVQGFIKSKGLSLPVLLDSDGKVSGKYKADAIPETVVIGKDGTVRKVLVGAYPGTEKALHEAVETAMKASK